MAEPNCVSCDSCGFMAVSTTPDPNDAAAHIMECGQHARDSGNAWHFRTPEFQRGASGVVVCTVGVADLPHELDTEQPRVIPHNPSIATKRVIARPRQCTSWIRYRPGLSPKDHLFIRMFEEWERERRQWEAEQTAARIAWENDEREKQRRWQEEQTAKAQERDDRIEAERRAHYERLSEAERGHHLNLSENQQKFTQDLSEKAASAEDKRWKVEMKLATMGVILGLVAAALATISIFAATPDSVIGGWMVKRGWLPPTPEWNTPSFPTEPASPAHP